MNTLPFIKSQICFIAILFSMSIILMSNKKQINDLEELQLMLDSNDSVVISKKKSYYISGSLYLKNNQKIIGNNTKIYQLKKNTPIFITTNKRNIEISGFHLIGYGNDYEPSSSSQAVGISCWGSKELKIFQNAFENFSNTGVLGLRETSNVRIFNNNFTGTNNNNKQYYQKDHTGITIGGENIFINDNFISNSSQGIMIAEGSNKILINNNKIFDISLEHGIYIDTSCNNINISHNTIKNTVGSGIKLQNNNIFYERAENVVIEGNIIENTSIGDGILLYDSSNNGNFFYNIIIVNNQLKNIGQHGINIRECKYITVQYNKISEIRRAGIYIRNSKYLDIKNNSVTATRENGLFDEGTGENINISNNIFENVGIDGIEKNGLSSGIFMENGYKRRILNNKIIGSDKMLYAVYVANDKEKTLEVSQNELLNVQRAHIKITGYDKSIKVSNNKSSKIIIILN